MTDLLGTPTVDTISGVRNEKARKYLTDMRKKYPVPLADKFSNADPLALRLLQKLLAFDPKDRPTAEEALADPYFKGLGKVEREPSCQPISKLEFEFERRRVTKEDIRELIFREILEYHPQLLKDYMAGNEGTNYLYPSAIGQFRKQFAYLEENGGKSGPVIPLQRKHVSLPRSTVNSSTIPPKAHQNLPVYDNRRISEEVCSGVRVADMIPGNISNASRPPPRIPTAKPGRVVGPVLPYEGGRNIKDAYDGRVYAGNAVLPPQTISPHHFFKTTTGNQEKLGTEATRESSHVKQQSLQGMAAKPAPGMTADLNTNPYYPSQGKASPLNNQIAIDAKLLQAQSQFGVVGAAAVAVAAHREIGAVQFGLSS
ncbi:unnamed protein product [Ilex paraguariensis]|uniref:Uncharacterized protein n=1 Tax=Ilex paraguariensis TaxID=185542 RepID=A0ABC8QNF9_9AQUA